MQKRNLNYIIRNIRNLREKDFLSQEYMAAKMGIGQNAYSKIELGKTKITIERLFAIAEVLGVEIVELLQPPNSLKEEKDSAHSIPLQGICGL